MSRIQGAQTSAIKIAVMCGVTPRSPVNLIH